MINTRCDNLDARIRCRDGWPLGALLILKPTPKITSNRRLPNARLWQPIGSIGDLNWPVITDVSPGTN
jgi:hypothetical protein